LPSACPPSFRSPLSPTLSSNCPYSLGPLQPSPSTPHSHKDPPCHNQWSTSLHAPAPRRPARSLPCPSRTINRRQLTPRWQIALPDRLRPWTSPAPQPRWLHTITATPKLARLLVSSFDCRHESVALITWPPLPNRTNKAALLPANHPPNHALDVDSSPLIASWLLPFLLSNISSVDCRVAGPLHRLCLLHLLAPRLSFVRL
jgi:hypothetical protein